MKLQRSLRTAESCLQQHPGCSKVKSCKRTALPSKAAAVAAVGGMQGGLVAARSMALVALSASRRASRGLGLPRMLGPILSS